MWRNICDSRWRSRPPKALIASKGYHWYFRQLSKTSQQSQEGWDQEIPPPRLRSENLVLVINIRNQQQGKSVSATLQGGRLDALILSRGELLIPFDTPVDLGKLPLIPSSKKGTGQFLFRDCTVNACCENWMETVHLFRMNTNVCCCIHETDAFRYMGWYYDLESQNMVSQNIPAKGEIHLINTGGGTWDLTETGQDMKKRIKQLVSATKDRNLHLKLKMLSTIRLMGDHDGARFKATQLKVEIANFLDLQLSSRHGNRPFVPYEYECLLLHSRDRCVSLHGLVLRFRIAIEFPAWRYFGTRYVRFAVTIPGNPLSRLVYKQLNNAFQAFDSSCIFMTKGTIKESVGPGMDLWMDAHVGHCNGPSFDRTMPVPFHVVAWQQDACR